MSYKLPDFDFLVSLVSGTSIVTIAAAYLIGCGIGRYNTEQKYLEEIADIKKELNRKLDQVQKELNRERERANINQRRLDKVRTEVFKN